VENEEEEEEIKKKEPGKWVEEEEEAGSAGRTQGAEAKGEGLRPQFTSLNRLSPRPSAAASCCLFQQQQQYLKDRYTHT